jgi:hypothetical protein
VFLVLALVLLALATLSALDNRGLERRSRVVDRLAGAEKARLGEVLHLHVVLGDSIWPGWSGEELPVVLYNERYAFLIGLADPPAGWIKVPGRKVRGGAWERVPADTLAGAPYYRQLLPTPRVTPEAFTVRVGDHWAASLPTYEWLCIDFAEQVRRRLPAPLAAVFPYEAFHAHQGREAPERLAAAERATAAEAEYPDDPAFAESWRREIESLARGARAVTRDECLALARQFLAARAARRATRRLAPALIDYERQREWLEGLAKYAEVEAWRRAAQTPGYHALGELARDPDFHAYAGFDRKWQQEIVQLRWSRDDERFYGTGMAQAVMLDRLLPGWKSRALADSIFLEDLLAESVRPARR